MSNNLYETCKIEVEKLKSIVRFAEEEIQKAPEGRISVFQKSKSVVGFYFSEEKGQKPRYLTKKHKKLITELLNKRYNTNVIRIAKKQIALFESFLDKYKPDALKEEYYDVNESCRDQVTFYEIPDEEFVKQWTAEKYKGNPYSFDGNDFITDNNEKVRSKSEVIIANRLSHFGIPYRYEYPFITKDKKTIYPDFTILNRKTRETIIWEHFGKMDSDSYCDRMYQKITLYAENGITVGNGLVVTLEDCRNPLSLFVVNQIIKNLAV